MKELIAYAKTFLNVPYIWGGTHPAFGLDCSEFVQHVLASVGMDPKGDQTAQALFNHFINGNFGDEVWKPLAGSLMFYGHDKSTISHVALCISEHQLIEAGGGGSNCTDLSKSIASRAMVRLRPIDHRKDLVAVINPRFPEWLRQMELPLG